MKQMKSAVADWIKTSQMCEDLGCHKSTLLRLKDSGYLRENQHWRKVNPLSPRGVFVWHRTRTLLKMDAA